MKHEKERLRHDLHALQSCVRNYISAHELILRTADVVIFKVIAVELQEVEKALLSQDFSSVVKKLEYIIDRYNRAGEGYLTPSVRDEQRALGTLLRKCHFDMKKNT